MASHPIPGSPTADPTSPIHQPHLRTGIFKLDLDIRLIIWRLVYELEPPRIVEIHTNKRTDTDEHATLSSPSPRPLVVNICWEARAEAKIVAERAGHVLSPLAADSPPIYFSPGKDVKYVPRGGGGFEAVYDFVVLERLKLELLEKQAQFSQSL